jgi:hypothetical protein
MQSRITVLKYLNLRNGTAAQGEEKRISLPLHRRWSKSIDAARGRNPLSSSQGVRKPWEGIHRGFTCRPWRAWGSGAGLAGGLGAALLLAFARAAGAARQRRWTRLAPSGLIAASDSVAWIQLTANTKSCSTPGAVPGRNMFVCLPLTSLLHFTSNWR